MKPTPSSSRARPAMRGGPGTADAGRITYTSVSLASVLLRAYDVKPFQLAGPEWIWSERYDILATLPPGTTTEQFQAMLQKLLAERFRLAVHHEARALQGYELVSGKSGPKLKASVETAAESGALPNDPPSPPKVDTNGFPILNAPGMAMMEGVRNKAVVSYLTAKAQPLRALVERLSREFRMPIADKTGLTGKYDFTLEFAPQPPGALPPPPSVEGLPSGADDSAPNLINAVQEQLGLKLTPSRITVDVLVVDRAERVPTEN